MRSPPGSQTRSRELDRRRTRPRSRARIQLGSTQQVARILSRSELTPAARADGLLDGYPGARSIRDEHRSVGDRGWREYKLPTLPRALPSLLRRPTLACTHLHFRRLLEGGSDDEPQSFSDPDPYPDLVQEIRSASCGIRLALRRPTTRRRLRILAHVSASRSCEAALAAKTSTATAVAVLLKELRSAVWLPVDAKMITSNRLRNLGRRLSRNLEIPRDEAQAVHRRYLARFPLLQDFIHERSSRRSATASDEPARRRAATRRSGLHPGEHAAGERLAVNFVMQGSNADIIIRDIAIHRRLARGRTRAPVLRCTTSLLGSLRRKSARSESSFARNVPVLSIARPWQSRSASATN